MKNIVLVTTTRNRPECFSLCEKWMQTQTKGWAEWVVVNDSDENNNYHYSMYQTVIMRDYTEDHLRNPRLPSICLNWLEAINYLKDRKDCYILPIEDDDYYAPEYIKIMSDMLDDVQLCGISRDAYYKLPDKKFRWMANCDHASLACTGFRREVLPHIERCCNVFKSVFIDMYLWAEFGTKDFPGTKKLLPQSHYGKKLHVGMKNLPPNNGLGIGHQDACGWNKDNINMKTLRDWVSHDAMIHYREMYRTFFAQ